MFFHVMSARRWKSVLLVCIWNPVLSRNPSDHLCLDWGEHRGLYSCQCDLLVFNANAIHISMYPLRSYPLAFFYFFRAWLYRARLSYILLAYGPACGTWPTRPGRRFAPRQTRKCWIFNGVHVSARSLVSLRFHTSMLLHLRACWCALHPQRSRIS